MTYAIGIDLGGTRIKAVSVTPDGRVLDQVMRRTGDQNDAQWIAGVRSVVEEIERGRDERASHIGVGAPGIASPDGRCISWMVGRLELLVNLEWAKVLGREAMVPVINDAQAAMLGEIWLGAARGSRNVVLLTLGTGVGGAIMVDGHLLRGHIGRAGHLGHMSLDPDGPKSIANCPGAMEHYIGNYTIRERTGGEFDSTYELLEAYRAGDKRAAEYWLDSVKHLAAAIASIINAVDPEVIVLAGGIAEADNALFVPLNDYLDSFEWRPHGHRVRIVKATAGEFAGAIGAAWNAMRVAGVAGAIAAID